MNPASLPQSTAVLSVRELRKSFFGVQVLHGVSFELSAGEVRAFVGENGSGKSTTMNILAGLLQRDSGEITLGGRDYRPRSGHDGEAAGIAFIQQELNIFANLSIEENLFIGHYPRLLPWLPVIDRRRMRSRAIEAMRQVGLTMSPATPASVLSPGERQLVEIAKALSVDARVMIFDEPTTSLTAPECERLFGLIERLRRQKMGIVYISHVLGDVFRLADTLTVLRDGRVVAAGSRGEMSEQDVITAMVGRSIETLYPRRDARACAAARAEPPMLEVDDLGKPGIVNDISFVLRPGEILGLGGLMGSGRTEVARIVFGLDSFDRGTIRFAGQSMRPLRPRERLRAGMAFLTEDRKREGLMLEASVGGNIGLAALPAYARGPLRLIARPSLQRAVREMAAQLDVKARGRDPIATLARALSGGNQQKVVLGKWLLRRPKLLILDEPTRGVDVGARSEIYRLIVSLADSGMAVLVISSELEELTGLCDRILVMRRGEIGGEFERGAFDRQAILAASMWKERAA
jgi:ABC-type sugar transport system ATPase subunit